jgi:hypothetical protein
MGAPVLCVYVGGCDGREHKEIFGSDDFIGLGVGGSAVDVGRVQHLTEFDEVVSGAGGNAYEWGVD